MVIALNNLAKELYLAENNNHSIPYANSALMLAQKLKYKTGEIDALTVLGNINNNLGNYHQGLKNHSAALNLRNKTDKRGISVSLINIGTSYSNLADHSKALQYYYKALKMTEELKDKMLAAATLGQIANVYFKEGSIEKALGFYFGALKIYEELRNKSGIARQFGNIGAAYSHFGHSSKDSDLSKKYYEKSLGYHLKAFQMDEKFGNKISCARHLTNIGTTFMNLLDFKSAMKYETRALKIKEEGGDKGGIILSLGNIGWLYSEMKEYDKAENYLKQAISGAQKIGALDYETVYEEKLSQLYSKTGRYKLAIEEYKKFIITRDSIINEENTKKQVRAEMNYDFDKKEAETKSEQERKDVIANKEKQKQKIVIASVSAGLILVLILAIVILRSLRQNQKKNKIITEQKEIVEKQKELVEEKQKEILDSIHYAKRIQTALITSEKYIDKNLNNLIKN